LPAESTGSLVGALPLPALLADPVQEMPLAAALQALADYVGCQPAGLTAAPGGATLTGAKCAVASFVVGMEARATRR
jgi:hypothetical protein